MFNTQNTIKFSYLERLTNKIGDIKKLHKGIFPLTFFFFYKLRCLFKNENKISSHVILTNGFYTSNNKPLFHFTCLFIFIVFSLSSPNSKKTNPIVHIYSQVLTNFKSNHLKLN